MHGFPSEKSVINFTSGGLSLSINIGVILPAVLTNCVMLKSIVFAALFGLLGVRTAIDTIPSRCEADGLSGYIA